MSTDIIPERWFVRFAQQDAAGMIQTLAEDGSCADIIRAVAATLLASNLVPNATAEPPFVPAPPAAPPTGMKETAK